jgi:hypothetical protein
MNAIRIRKKLDSDTLHLPELQAFLGKAVEIIVLEENGAPAEPRPASRYDAFFSLAGHDVVDPDAYKQLLDSSVLIDALRPADPRFRQLFTAHGAAVCGVTKAEVLYGARDQSDYRRLEAALAQFSNIVFPESLSAQVGHNLFLLRRGVTPPEGFPRPREYPGLPERKRTLALLLIANR